MKLAQLLEERRTKKVDVTVGGEEFTLEFQKPLGEDAVSFQKDFAFLASSDEPADAYIVFVNKWFPKTLLGLANTEHVDLLISELGLNKCGDILVELAGVRSGEPDHLNG